MTGLSAFCRIYDFVDASTIAVYWKMPTAVEEKQTSEEVVDRNLKNKRGGSSAEHEGRKRLPEDVQARMLADAEALEKRHRQRVKELKRQKFIRAKKALYSKLKFYDHRGLRLCSAVCAVSLPKMYTVHTELKKVQRRLQQTRKELIQLMSQQQEDPNSSRAAADNESIPSAVEASGEKLSERIAEAQRRLRLHLDDLNYIRLYPADEPYVALFPAQDTEESQKKRQDMRLRILQLLIDSRNGNEATNDEDEGRDDMFVDAPQAAEGTAADDADPFEDAQALTDEETEQTGSRTTHKHGGNALHTKRMSGSRDNKRAGGAAAAAMHKKGAQREGGGRKPPQHSRSNCNTNSSKSQLSGRKQFTPDKTCKQHSERRDKRRTNGTQHQTPKQKEREKQTNSSLASTDTKNQPTRIGLSKHKAANQHLIFDSDDE
ncbi:LOW QUALITY PROTEIN: uncharacterized protein EMH_0004470 [Eimeria mitis]|uniref:Uncharacterized protein n=1 Tax=Eimeria mitis TaxID=44415 RepID=U6KEN7_9EIME|nr:LOW QUALITY PROTEIN: uncharacterized protein EMH_0004470 [Eimeria mitis]CDJ35266.1 hypothetical protein, conserved [Eimeria mitis]